MDLRKTTEDLVKFRTETGNAAEIDHTGIYCREF